MQRAVALAGALLVLHVLIPIPKPLSYVIWIIRILIIISIQGLMILILMPVLPVLPVHLIFEWHLQ